MAYWQRAGGRHHNSSAELCDFNEQSEGVEMSDFSGMEQNFALASQPAMRIAEDYTRYEAPPPTELQADEVSFTQLSGTRAIARVMHLRQQIALPSAAVADPGFGTREKKETTLGSSALSRALASTSVPSATCR
jgi:hypothetical protein